MTIARMSRPPSNTLLITFCTPLCFFFLCSVVFLFWGYSFILLWHNDGPQTHVVVSFVCYFVLCFYVVVVLTSCLSQTVCVVSVVQITLNSHVRNLIEVIRFTLCFICPSLSLSGSPCLNKSYVLVTNTNLILCSSCSLMSLHCMLITLHCMYGMLFI